MGVVQGYSPLRDARRSSRGLDRAAAELFLRAQCAWLRQGLARADDPTAVRLVLAAHDTTHPSWIALIGQVRAVLGPDAADSVGALYALHGQVAGTLVRGSNPLLDPSVTAAVRGFLHGRLRTLTDRAVGVLDDGAGTAATELVGGEALM